MQRGRAAPMGGLAPALLVIGLAAVVVLTLLLLPPLFSPDLADPQAQFEVRDRARLTVAAVIGGFVVLAGVYVNWRRVSALERQVTTLQLGQITERFTRAIDQLGAVRPDGEPAPQIRAGGVRSLERIARESLEDFWPVLDILTAYLRSESPAASADVVVLGAMDIFEEAAHEIRSRMDVAFTIEAIQRLWPYESDSDDAKLNLARTFLPRLSFPGKDLGGANLEGAHLTGADFSGADLREANLPVAGLERANLREAYLWGSNLRASNLEGADFYATSLRSASLDGARLVAAKLIAGNLEGASLTGADLTNADLTRARLSYARLIGADLRDAKLDHANLEGADLQSADLEGANLKSVRLEGADLEGTNLNRVTWDDQTQWPEGFTPPPSA